MSSKVYYRKSTLIYLVIQVKFSRSCQVELNYAIVRMAKLRKMRRRHYRHLKHPCYSKRLVEKAPANNWRQISVAS